MVGGRATAPLALAGFCVLSSFRDVLSEALFKNAIYDASPVFLLFVYSSITQLAAAGVMLARKPISTVQWALTSSNEIVWVNIFTLTAFLFYFLAISSPLGAGLNSFVDYGSGPVFTALIGAMLLHEPIGRTFWLSAVLAVTGIVALNAPRISFDNFSAIWLLGLGASFLSSASSGFYRVYFKRLLQEGGTKASIIFFRLIATTFFTGIVLLMRPELFRSDLLLAVILIGFIGFTVPLFLTLLIIQHVTIRSFSMLLFSIPVMTLLLSASFGYTHIFPSDILAALLVFAGVTFHEFHSKNAL
jgi:drug/metabolite transporter (DMT)-like permease